MLKKLGWIFSLIGLLLIISGVLYPIGLIGKTPFVILLLSGSVIMFMGSMIRSFLGYRK